MSAPPGRLEFGADGVIKRLYIMLLPIRAEDALLASPPSSCILVVQTIPTLTAIGRIRLEQAPFP